MVDLRWLNPLPAADIVREAAATGRVLVVDETRRSGGVGEGVLAALVDAGYVGAARRVASADSYHPARQRRQAPAGLRGDDRAGCPLPSGRAEVVSSQVVGAPLARGAPNVWTTRNTCSVGGRRTGRTRRRAFDSERDRGSGRRRT